MSDNDIEESMEESIAELYDSQEEYSDTFENTTSTIDIDELTLSLLMNKTHYKKYVSQTEGIENDLNQQYIHDNRKYRNQILELTARVNCEEIVIYVVEVSFIASTLALTGSDMPVIFTFLL